jgi:hypothetical protein
MLSDIEIPTLDGPPSNYRRTLADLLVLAQHGAIETLVPGHGAIARGQEAVLERFQHDLDYLAAVVRGVTEARGGGLTLEAATERLAALDYTGKSGLPFPMADNHRKNVAHAWREAEQAAGKLRGGGGPRGSNGSRGGQPHRRGGGGARRHP